MKGYLIVIFGFVMVVFGTGVFFQIPKMTFISNYWADEQYNSSKLKRAYKKFLGVGLILGGLLIAFGGYIAIQENIDNELDQKEAIALGISLQDHKIYKAASLYLPKETTLEQYQEIDAEGRSKGFKNAYEYVVTYKKASDAGVTIEQYVQQHPTASSAISDGTSFVVLPAGEFFTDKGQVTRSVYRLACQKATLDYKFTALAIKHGYSTYPQGKLIANLGESAISQAKIWWDENYGCLGSFVVSGMVDGSNHIIPLQGKVQSFENYGGAVRGIISTY